MTEWTTDRTDIKERSGVKEDSSQPLPLSLPTTLPPTAPRPHLGPHPRPPLRPHLPFCPRPVSTELLVALLCSPFPWSAESLGSVGCIVRPRITRSRVLNLFFPLPDSFRTSAHRIFCCSFHLPHFLNRCSLVCVLYQHHPHSAVSEFFVHLKYCPVQQCPVLSR